MIPYDFVTLGESMVRLSPPNNQTIEQAGSMDVNVGGTESNTAITLSRFGMRTAWISKLVDNPLGRRIASTITSQGVDTSGVVWTTKGRNGTYFIEFGKGLRAHRVTYDRKNSAVNQLKPDEIDWSVFKGARIVHLTGITPALSGSCHRLVEAVIDRARKGGSLISFDVNHRTKLWSFSKARRVVSAICANVDILLMNGDDAKNVFNAKGSPEKIVGDLASRFGCKTVVLTMGKEGAICKHEGEVFRSERYPTLEVDRVGAGDAFTGAFLYGYLKKDIAYALNFAVATSALKFTIPGDLAYVTRTEVEAVLSASGSQIQR